MAGWFAGIGLALMIGIFVGHGNASRSVKSTIESTARLERAQIAQECRSAGSFVVKRTAFSCEVRKK